MKYLIIFAIFFATSLQAYAKNHYIITAGLAYGGDTILKNENKNLTSGGRIQGEFGYQIRLSDRLGLRFLIGYKFNSLEKNDITYSFDSYPSSALLVYRKNRLSIGGGVAYHIEPEYEISNSGKNTHVVFDNALGYSAFFSMRAGRGVYMEMRYTDITYKGAKIEEPDGKTMSTLDGNNFTLSGVLQF